MLAKIQIVLHHAKALAPQPRVVRRARKGRRQHEEARKPVPAEQIAHEAVDDGLRREVERDGGLPAREDA